MKLVGSIKTIHLYYLGDIVLVGSLGLAIAGEFHAMLAWWIAIGLLLPPLLWSYKTPYVALKTLCNISFITQFFTVPFFYLNRDNYPWGNVKPFYFTAWEVFPILSKVSLFLFALVLFFQWLYPISLFGGSLNKFANSNLQAAASINRFDKYSVFDVKHNKNPKRFTLYIIVLIAVLTQINLWSYSQGVGLTGVEPPNLPYRLSGILFYLIKYISPLILAYLFFKSKRGWILMLLLMAYGWVLGLCSVSKGGVMIVMLPVIALAWIDKRKIMLTVAIIGTMIGVSLADNARVYVHIVTAGKSGFDSSNNIFTLIVKVFTDPDTKLWDLEFFPLLFNGILSRIEGFSNLVMAQYYDPDAVIGAWGFVLRMIWQDLAKFDMDLHSIQWQGYVLPEGFYNGGALLSNAVIIGNAGMLWVVLSAIVTAIILIIIEKRSNRLTEKYGKRELLSAPIIFFMSFIFFNDAGGSTLFLLFFFLLFFASLMPPIVHKINGVN